MSAAAVAGAIAEPLDMGSRELAERKFELYPRLLAEAPVCRAKVSVFKLYVVSRYDDCVALLNDPRFVRDRSRATGGGRFPFPMPRSAALLARSMIVEDDPAHRRLRNLVSKAFTPRAVERLAGRVEGLTHELLDRAQREVRVDLMPAYALPIPVTVIAELVGVSAADMPRFRDSVRVLSQGLSGWSLLRTVLFDLRAARRFLQELIARKRADPADDLLSGLIQAEEDGDRLSEDELVSMLFLLIVAGFETTVHLITNGVATLLDHPDQLERLRAEPDLMDSAVEEILRHRGPVQGTKLNYPTEEVTLHGRTLPKGTPVVPLLGAANHDPEAFEKPEVFDVARSPNRHLAFGFGKHFCLGAQLARMETRIALKTLLERSPNLRLAVPPESLTLQNVPFWHRYQGLPVVAG